MHETHNITATLVSDSDRLSFLPRVFGVRAMMRAESMVYDWMGRLCEGYGGGYWHFFSLSNGGMFMAPNSEDGYRIAVDGNGFSGHVSSEAAGIVATLFALCQLAEQTGADRLIDLYHLLRDFASTHEEASLILSAID